MARDKDRDQEDILTLVDDCTAPDVMSVREAINFIKDLRSELEMKLDALEHDNDPA